MSKPIISSNQLRKILNDDNLVILDLRAGNDAYKNYLSEHLSGAIFVNLEDDLSQIENPKYGGRHPLPSPKSFADFLGRSGISPTSAIVLYDDQNGANAAARCWWMLRAIGHEDVKVLDGGWADAKANGLPTCSGKESSKLATNYPDCQWLLPTVDMDFVARNLVNKTHDVIDVRSTERFDGQQEPIDLIAGHIPNALSVPLTENLDDRGLFKSPDELQELYSPFDPQKLIVHCGSGVTACHTLLAFELMGAEIPSLYVGSWSEWSRNDQLMILKED